MRDGPRETLLEAWVRARSLVQYAAATTLRASCESGNYQLTFLHRLTLFESVRFAKQRAISSHDTHQKGSKTSRCRKAIDKALVRSLVSPFHRCTAPCCSPISPRPHTDRTDKPPAARAETTLLPSSIVIQYRSATHPLRPHIYQRRYRYYSTARRLATSPLAHARPHACP